MIFINTVKNLLNLILTIYEVQKNGQRYDSLSEFGFKIFTNKYKKLPTDLVSSPVCTFIFAQVVIHAIYTFATTNNVKDVFLLHPNE